MNMQDIIFYIIAAIVFVIAFGVGLFYNPKPKSRSQAR